MGTGPLMLIGFLMAVSVTGLAALLLTGRNQRLEGRLQELSGKGRARPQDEGAATLTRAVKRALPKMGEQLMPEEGEKRTELKARLIQAGLYGRQAMPLFLGVKLLLMVGPALIGLLAGSLGLIPTKVGVLGGACASIFGLIGPSFWLDQKKAGRQKLLRRGLPDAFDLIVICMDGGLSLTGALARVVGELETAHPVLALELKIVQREVQLGQPLADSLRGFAVRTDLAEVRSLAATVKNAERFGASMVKALRTYSDTLRIKRQQQAEIMAQKAGTKILFPTLLFIFPAILIIILGPAAIQMMETLGNMKK